jgi:hypothetical protein
MIKEPHSLSGKLNFEELAILQLFHKWLYSLASFNQFNDELFDITVRGTIWVQIGSESAEQKYST